MELESKTKPRKLRLKGTHGSWGIYIHKVLKLIDVGAQISSKASEQLDEFIKILARKLAGNARTTCINSGKSTVGKLEIQLAVQLFLPEKMAKQTLKKTENSINMFCSRDRSTSTKSVRREQLAGLYFSVSLAEKFIREFGASDLNVSKKSSFALAAVLENITLEILESAVEKARDDKKVIITIRHIALAVLENNDLNHIKKELGIEFLGGGVVPHIREELIPTKEEKAKRANARKKTTKEKDENKKHRYLPGTKAIMDIRRYQKTSTLLLQKLPFERTIRNIASSINDTLELKLKDIHFGSGSIEAIQYFVEQQTVALLCRAQDLAIHGNRDGVNDKDVKLAWDFTQPLIPSTNEEIEEVGENGIERLAFRGGIKRKNAGMYEIVRCYMFSLLHTVLAQTLKIVKYRNVITVNIRDLQHALQTLQINFIVPYTMGKPKPTIRKSV